MRRWPHVGSKSTIAKHARPRMARSMPLGSRAFIGLLCCSDAMPNYPSWKRAVQDDIGSKHRWHTLYRSRDIRVCLSDVWKHELKWATDWLRLSEMAVPIRSHTPHGDRTNQPLRDTKSLPNLTTSGSTPDGTILYSSRVSKRAKHL